MPIQTYKHEYIIIAYVIKIYLKKLCNIYVAYHNMYILFL